MLKILNAKILEYQNDVPIIVLTLSRSGRITRALDDNTFEHDFESDGFKKEILFALIENDGYVPTKEIKQRIGSKSTGSVSKTIASINTVLKLLAASTSPSPCQIVSSRKKNTTSISSGATAFTVTGIGRRLPTTSISARSL